MKIERLSENQIRCVLSKADLNEKQLKISELAYGTQKAKELFRDLMRQASVELGFEVDNTPLMIEAIPVSPESLVLIVTKVEDPEELDTRFSRFSNVGEYDVDDDEDGEYCDDDEYMDDDEDGDDYTENIYESGDGQAVARVEISGPGAIPQNLKDVIENIFSSISGLAGAEFAGLTDNTTGNVISQDASASQNAGENKEAMVQSLYVFDSLPVLINAAKQVAYFYFSENTLYKDPASGKYYLLLTNSDNTRPEFTRVCNILTEYGTSRKLTYAMPAHFKEHFTAILEEDALQTLSALA